MNQMLVDAIEALPGVSHVLVKEASTRLSRYCAVSHHVRWPDGARFAVGIAASDDLDASTIEHHVKYIEAAIAEELRDAGAQGFEMERS